MKMVLAADAINFADAAIDEAECAVFDALDARAKSGRPDLGQDSIVCMLRGHPADESLNHL